MRGDMHNCIKCGKRITEGKNKMYRLRYEKFVGRVRDNVFEHIKEYCKGTRLLGHMCEECFNKEYGGI